MSDVNKFNEEVVEKEMQAVFTACENLEKHFQTFKQAALEAAPLCGRALEDVISRLVEKDEQTGQSMDTLIKDLVESMENVKAEYTAFAHSIREAMDESEIHLN